MGNVLWWNYWNMEQWLSIITLGLILAGIKEGFIAIFVCSLQIQTSPNKNLKLKLAHLEGYAKWQKKGDHFLIFCSLYWFLDIANRFVETKISFFFCNKQPNKSFDRFVRASLTPFCAWSSEFSVYLSLRKLLIVTMGPIIGECCLPLHQYQW